MSYILEALRRAETERGRRRRVPGLHTQPVPVPPGEEQGASRARVWPWLALGLGAGVLLPLLWSWWSSDPSVDDTLAAHTAATGSVTPQGAAAAQEPAAPPPPAATATAEPAEPPPAPAPERPHRKAPAAKAAKPEPAVAAAPAATKSIAPSEGTKAAPAPAAASVPEPRLPGLAELPAELQRAVPPLSFGGSVYSDVVAQRMVILNGQVLREGDAVTDEVRLEQIRPRSAVMRVRGQRFELAF